MNNLISKSNGENTKSTKLMTLPSLSSWIEDVFNKNLENEFVSNFNTGITLPAVNIKDTANEYVVEMAVPGLKKSDFDINIDNQLLTISADFSDEKENHKEEYTRREFGYSSFKRSFSLPETVEFDKISAAYNDGILKVILPKRDEAKKKPIRSIKIS